MMSKMKSKAVKDVKKTSSKPQTDTPVTVRLSDQYLDIIERIGTEMGIDGRATVLKHCLIMRAKELKVL
jgi:hypothetical protein